MGGRFRKIRPTSFLGWSDVLNGNAAIILAEVDSRGWKRMQVVVMPILKVSGIHFVFLERV